MSRSLPSTSLELLAQREASGTGTYADMHDGDKKATARAEMFCLGAGQAVSIKDSEMTIASTNTSQTWAPLDLFSMPSRQHFLEAAW